MKIKLLQGVDDGDVMKKILLEMMDRTGAEFCAYYSGGKDPYLHILLASRELSARIPEIKAKLIKSHQMFSNGLTDNGECLEKIYLKSNDNNIAYLVGESKIKSYFLVPVMSDLHVAGTLFLGSIRDDAFVREDIEYFRDMADREDSRRPVVYRLGGQLGILDKLVRELTIPCALISHNGFILSSNSEFASLFDLGDEPAESIRSLDDKTLFHFSGIWNEFELIGADIKSRELCATESSDRCLSVDMIHLRELSKDVGGLLLVRDISGHKREELEREEILAVTAHELRTPMAALRNSLKIIADSQSGRYPGRDREEKEIKTEDRFIQTAIRTIDRLNLLVNGLVDSSSIRLNDHPVEAVLTDTKSFLEEASRIFLSSMEKKGISFSIDVEEKVKTLVFDPMMIEQVIQNLLSNSLKYVPSGGSVSIRVRSVEKDNERFDCGLIDRPGYAEIRMIDTGPGIPEEVILELNRENIDGYGKRSPVRGLGLYIARRIISRHGGSLRFEDLESDGSTISMTIPADRKTGEAVRSINAARSQIDESISRGYHPVVYYMYKETDECWFDLTDLMTIQPDIYPVQGNINDRGLFLWPVDRNTALAMTLNGNSQDDPLFFIPGSKGGLRIIDDGVAGRVRIGWSVFPVDGLKSDDLINNAVKVKVHEVAEID
ncbi:MAG: GAF domain-containing sensor histidine kinase [Candidatus Krumholzibacteriota bacterium]|nr:GAF domain-containing sensor histidine kinase [Candidatus Krumholzibacteriota bacterium]